MKIDGGCHCGAIAYEAEGDPDQTLICHCTDCQTLSGSAFRTVLPVPGETFRLLSGEPRIYVKTAESGRQRAQAFCADCGTPLYAASTDERPAVYNLRAGTIRQRDLLRPRSQCWTRSAQDWLGDIPSMQRIERQ